MEFLTPICDVSVCLLSFYMPPPSLSSLFVSSHLWNISPSIPLVLYHSLLIYNLQISVTRQNTLLDHKSAQNLITRWKVHYNNKKGLGSNRKNRFGFTYILQHIKAMFKKPLAESCFVHLFKSYCPITTMHIMLNFCNICFYKVKRLDMFHKAVGETGCEVYWYGI